MFRGLLVLLVLGVVLAWWLGYVPGHAPVTPHRGPDASTSTGSGPIDPEVAGDRAAELGERTAKAVNHVARGIDDGAITAKITSKMALDDGVRARNIRVHTQAGVVTLTGTVMSQAERQKAVQLARDTDGVQSVTDRLEVPR